MNLGFTPYNVDQVVLITGGFFMLCLILSLLYLFEGKDIIQEKNVKDTVLWKFLNTH